ncbi:MAG: nitrogenase component 1 [Dehalococcoidia bacterium]
MKGLYKVLPPFAPDYSGVCSVLFELGGITVIHDGGGCTGNFTCYDEPRWYGSSSAVFSSDLREVDAVLGNDERLLERVESAARTLGRGFIAIIGSPAPMVIGTDYPALARILHKRTGLPVLPFDSNGIGYYDSGASLAFLELARRFVKPAAGSVSNGVNIMGATPLDFGSREQIECLIRLLTGAGCQLVSCWTMGSTLDDITQAAKARLNIVVSRSGLEAARYLEKEYAIPYLASLPVGDGPTHSFINAVRAQLGRNGRSTAPQKPVQPLSGIRKALVIGEQVASNAIRDCLRLDMRIPDVTVASFFGMDQTLLEEGDRVLGEEAELTSLATEQPYDIIIGDPLYHDLIAPYREGRYVALPHIAVSSRLYWDDDFDYIGEAGLNLLQQGILNSLNDTSPGLSLE